MTKFNSESMTEALDRFGQNYKFPVYASITNLSGFFSRSTDMMSGYAAVTDDHFLLLVQVPLFGNSVNADYFRLPVLGIKQLKVKKLPLFNSYSVDVRGIADGKKYRFKFVTVSRVAGNGFPEQGENSLALIEKLKKWSEEI
jgi:hypothetical protein